MQHPIGPNALVPGWLSVFKIRAGVGETSFSVNRRSERFKFEMSYNAQEITSRGLG